MERKQRLLFIFFRPPFPPIGGDKIRMFQNLKMLSKTFKVDVLFLNDTKTDNRIISEINKWSSNIFPFDLNKKQYYLNTLKGFISNKKPLQVNYFYHKQVQKWVDKNINNYNLVFCSTIRTTEYVINKPIFKIIDFVDAISMNYEKAITNKTFGLWKIMYLIDKRRLKKYERNVGQLFNKKIIISDIDRKYILGNTSNFDLEVISNSVSFRENYKKSYDNNQNIISFVGKMDYEPNQSAVKYFVKNIFPTVLEECPDAQFNILGTKPTKEVRKLSKYRRVNVLGYVKDIDELIKASKLVVAPMVSGAGLQNKILQSMALKKCVITTSIGAEGLTGISKKEIIIEDNSIKFAKKICSLLADETKLDEIGFNARKFVNENFSEIEIEKKLLNYLLN